MERAFSSALRLLLDREDVTHVMRGRRFRAGRWTDEQCISFGVKRKKSIRQLDPGEILPASINDVPTDVIQARPKLSFYVPSYSVICGGISISPEDLAEADFQQVGTMGAVFTDDVNGGYVGLTNYHVLARGSAPMVPTSKVIHPGSYDGGRTDGYGRIGSTVSYVVDENGDAAMFSLSKQAAMSILQSQVVLSGIGMANISDVVEKVGRTTGQTQGEITADGYVSIDYSDYGYGSIVMAVFAYAPLTDPNEEIVAGGDSGSIVYRLSDSAAIGLHVAHVTGPMLAYACHLDTLASLLQFSVPTMTQRTGMATASTLLGTRMHGQASGSLSVAATIPAFTLKGFAIEDSYISYATMEAYAIAQGYASEAAFLAAVGYATALEYAESEGYETVADFLAGQTIPSMQWVLAKCGAVVP